MSYHLTRAEELLAAAYLVFQFGAAALVAFVAARRLARPGDQLEALFVFVFLFLAQGVGAPLLAGCLNILYLPSVLAIHAVLAVLALWWARRRPVSAGGDDRSRRWRHPSAVLAIAFGALVSYVVLAARFALRRPLTRDFDTIEYHLSNLASWLQHHSIWHLPFISAGNITGTHPGNGELFGLWLALPTHGDELTFLTPTFFAVLAIVASAVVARELANDERFAPVGALAALAVLFAPVYFKTQVDSLATDMTSASATVAALAFVLLANRRRAVAPAILGGAAFGMALGAKYTSFIPCALLALAAIPLLRKAKAWRWLIPGVVVFAGPWLIRNLAITGNPVFPQALPGMPGTKSPYFVLDTSILDHVREGNTDIVKAWLRLARKTVGPVAVAIVAGVVLALFRRHPERRGRLVVSAVVVLAAAGFLATPFTGGGPTGLGFIYASTFRYALAAMLLGAALAAVVAPHWLGAGLTTAVIGWDLYQLEHLRREARSDLIVTNRWLAIAAGAGVVAGLFVYWYSSRGEMQAPPVPLLQRGRIVLGAAAVVVLVGAFGASTYAFHYLDRGDRHTDLERTLLDFGRTRPVIALGIGDLRALLGPRLERPLVGVWRGGKAHDVPFIDEAQMRRVYLGDTDAPLPPQSLSTGLDAAIDATGADLLVVGDNPAAYPTGWEPSAEWCSFGSHGGATVYAKGAALDKVGGCPS